jgi:adenosylcobalamin-dependent ribonucleoside-triphosphate reductase
MTKAQLSVVPTTAPRVRWLDDSFLSQYADFPKEMNALGKFVYYRTYSRWLPVEKRRETWKETCIRGVDYNIGLAKATIKSKAEAEKYFDKMYHLQSFLSGRTLWAGGTAVADKYPMSNFNCAFTILKSWEDFRDMFYLLMIGTGVGVRILRRDVCSLPRVRASVKLITVPYKPLPKKLRNDNTIVEVLTQAEYQAEMAEAQQTIYKPHEAYIVVGDSKEGWVDALYKYLLIMSDEQYSHVTEIHITYDNIRPKGERLKTFGGTASGGESMVVMFEKIHNVLTTDSYAPKPVDGVLRPIHALDIANIIGSLVVVGGVRRTSEIALVDPDDTETLEAKLNITADKAHRYMSNNSIFYEEKPTREALHHHFSLLKRNGEPGFINALSARLRKLLFDGCNPCAEVLMRAKQLCNLTTTNVMGFVKNGKIDFSELYKAHRMVVRASMRMTLVTLELDDWDIVHKEDRIVGVSLMGWFDMLDAVGLTEADGEDILCILRAEAREEAVIYASELGIEVPELVTTIKPEGTLSKVAGGVSPGAHRNRAPWYIRRVRINAHDPLCEAVEKLGWVVKNETMQGIYDAQGNYIPVTTKVIEFPVHSTAKITTRDVSAIEQLNTYYSFQENYTDHNTSITIDVLPHEWDEIEQNVWDNWDKVIAVTFIGRDSNFYELMPEEPCTEEEYNRRVAEMKELDPEMLMAIERAREDAGEDFELEDLDCKSGNCGVR